MFPFWHLHGADAHDAAGAGHRHAIPCQCHRELRTADAAAPLVRDDGRDVDLVFDVTGAPITVARRDAAQRVESDLAAAGRAVDEGGVGRAVHVDDQHVAAELLPARVAHRLHVLGRGARVVHHDRAVLGDHGHVVADVRVHRLRGVDRGVAAIGLHHGGGVVLPRVGAGSAGGHEGPRECKHDELTHRCLHGLGRLSDSNLIGRSVFTGVTSFNAENSGIGYKKALRKVELSHKVRRGRD